MDGGFVPDHHTLDTHLSEADVGGTPGLDLHGNPEYAGGQLGLMVIEDAALAVGMAKGALDAYEDLVRTRATMYPPIRPRTEDADYQRTYGDAVGLIETAEAALLGAVGRWQEAARRGPDPSTRETQLRIAAICHEVIRLSWTAVADHLFPTAGSSAVLSGERLERVWRDLSMLHTHTGVAVFLRVIAKRELAKARFEAE
jgi:3-hydroxy-9,10-secoandrosta-1,3,5(10)-triene-9,17-dione monooxygenase